MLSTQYCVMSDAMCRRDEMRRSGSRRYVVWYAVKSLIIIERK